MVCLNRGSWYDKEKKQKTSSLDIAPLTILISGVLQPRKWQLTGNDCSYRGARSGSPEAALTDYWVLSCSQQAYYAPVNHARSSPRNPLTKLHGSLLIYRPLRDGWLSWPCWLTDSGLLNHNVVTHPASSLAQDRESSSSETSVLTTMLRRQ